ncbi:MAG: hypothetical protein GY784_16645 [Gammaproteobacteria bacterium]|nr:hypothetical protein [Gammaproteobacteria bacterium]
MLWEMAPAWRLGGIILLVVSATLAITGWQLRLRLPDALAHSEEMAR